MPINPILTQNSGALQNAFKAVASAANGANSEKTATIVLLQKKYSNGGSEKDTIEIFYKDGKITKIERHLVVLMKEGLLAGGYKFAYRYFPKGTKQAGENNYASEIDRIMDAGQGEFFRTLNERSKAPNEDEIISFVEAMSEALEKCPESKIKDMLDAATKPIREDYKNNRELKARQQKKSLEKQRSKFFNEAQ